MAKSEKKNKDPLHVGGLFHSIRVILRLSSVALGTDLVRNWLNFLCGLVSHE